ncbi:hypothetical protein M413DRAFT_441998 [Hebeloma cylindrosporum]|uniref:Uncharacterized protein n=1 Tax=Hebeloma cylindrosporum TaxID=76867 RepID=A0A0C2YWE1_HEBCY|nr:hypothetical protein M413DRAFT_441998 [Hebeloma cylindrosporum h7]
MGFDATTTSIPEADSLESPKRNKIIIYAKSREATTKDATPRRSIFSRRVEKGAQKEGYQGGTPTEDVNLGQLKSSPKQSTMPKAPVVLGGPLERLSQEKKPMKRAESLDCVQPDQTTSPTTFATKRQTPTTYAAECANCPCSAQGPPPCQRCRLLLLADRFCNLVDTQCEKWKSEPRC